MENDIVMSVHITLLRPRLLLTLSQCNRCFVVGVDDTHTKTVAPIVSIEESFDSSFFLVCLQPRGRQGDRCKYMLRVYVFIFFGCILCFVCPLNEMLSWKNWHSLEVYFISELLTIFLGLFFPWGSFLWRGKRANGGL